MAIDLRLPNISGDTPELKIEQIQSYLYQLVQDLNFALNSVSSNDPESGNYSAASAYRDAGATFTSIKSLIIKSKDIINAYYDEIKKRLDDVYVADSDYQIFVNSINNSINSINNSINELSNSINELESAVTQSNVIVETDLLEFASGCDDGLTPIVTTADTTSIPEAVGYDGASGLVQKASSDKIYVSLVNYGTGDIATNVYTDGNWSGWKFVTPV